MDNTQTPKNVSGTALESFFYILSFEQSDDQNYSGSTLLVLFVMKSPSLSPILSSQVFYLFAVFFVLFLLFQTKTICSYFALFQSRKRREKNKTVRAGQARLNVGFFVLFEKSKIHQGIQNKN